MSALALGAIVVLAGVVGWLIGRGAPDARVGGDLSQLGNCPDCGTVRLVCGLCFGAGTIPEAIQERFLAVDEWKRYLALDEACFRTMAYQRGPVRAKKVG